MLYKDAITMIFLFVCSIPFASVVCIFDNAAAIFKSKKKARKALATVFFICFLYGCFFFLVFLPLSELSKYPINPIAT